MISRSDVPAWPTAAAAELADPYVGYAASYHLLFGDQRDDVPFYLQCAAQHARPGTPLIELGVGTGRLAGHLIAAGHTVLGVDASQAMLSQARQRLNGEFRAVEADLRTMQLGCQVPLILGAYGTLAHLLEDHDRAAAFRTIHDHLEPGGWLIYDDRPSWMLPGPETGRFEIEREIADPDTGLLLRLTVSRLRLADQPLTVSDEVLDWLRDGALVRREVIRLYFRDTPLADELRLLADAGFCEPELLGGFDLRPFDHREPMANQRLILCCRRSPR